MSITLFFSSNRYILGKELQKREEGLPQIERQMLQLCYKVQGGPKILPNQLLTDKQTDGQTQRLNSVFFYHSFDRP